MNNKKIKLIIIISAGVLLTLTIPVLIFLYVKHENRITNGEKCMQKRIELQERQSPGTDGFFAVCRLPADEKYDGDN